MIAVKPVVFFRCVVYGYCLRNEQQLPVWSTVDNLMLQYQENKFGVLDTACGYFSIPMSEVLECMHIGSEVLGENL